MSVALPTLRIGDPVRHEALSVFPLFSDSNSAVDYRLSDAALADETLKVWDRLLSGVIFDALEAGDTDQHASVADVERLVAAACDLPWEQAEAVGEGEEYRAESKRGDHASALAFEETVVHGSIVAAV